jgi:hypothetical protein
MLWAKGYTEATEAKILQGGMLAWDKRARCFTVKNISGIMG